MSALMASIKNKKTAGSSGGVKSDVGVLEAIEYFEVLQVASPFFGNVFTDAESVKALAMSMLIARFDGEQTVVENGEPGSWFGIILTGDVVVDLPTGGEVILSPGTLIGEMTLWTVGSVRSATIRGKAPGGLIATMLVDELPSFCEKHPDVGAKLMKLMGRSAIQKQVDNMRRALRSAMSPALQLSAGDDAAAAALKGILEEHAFTSDEAALVCASCQYGAFREGEVLAKPGSPWPPLVAIILNGSLTMAPWNLELTSGGCVGGLDFFGETLFGEAATIVGHADGTLAAMSFDSLNALLGLNNDNGEQEGAAGLLVDKLLRFIGGYSMQICEAAASSRRDLREAAEPPKRTPILRKASTLGVSAPAAAAEQSAFYVEKLRQQSASFVDQASSEREEVERHLAQKDQSVQHYKVLHAGVAGKLEKTQGLLKEAKEQLVEKEEEAKSLRRKARGSSATIDLTTSTLGRLIGPISALLNQMTRGGMDVGGEIAQVLEEASKLTNAESALAEAKRLQPGGEAIEEEDATPAEADGLGESPHAARASGRDSDHGGGWSKDVRRQFGEGRLGKAEPPPPKMSAETLAKVQEKQKENEKLLHKANQQKEAAMKLLEAAQRERALVIEESRKIEKANEILEQANADLLAHQEAFERRKLMPTDVLEMSTQTEERHVSSATQTDSMLLEPLVAQGALALAAERALDVEGALQTHGAAWLGAAADAVHAEARSLLTLLSSKQQVPLPPQARKNSPPFPPAKLDHTWRHALKEEVLSALAPLKEQISNLQPPPKPQAPSPPPHGSESAPPQLPPAETAPLPPPRHGAVAPAKPARTHVDDVAVPSWLVNPNEAVKFGQSPRSGKHLHFPAGAQQPSPRGDIMHANDALPPHQMMTSRAAARALVISKVDKQIAREVYEMRQLMRKQQELLPQLMHHID